MARSDAGPKQMAQYPLQLGARIGAVAQRPIQPLAPSFGEILSRVQFVPLRPARRQPHRHGPLAEQLGGEAVDGLDGRPVQLGDGVADALEFFIRPCDFSKIRALHPILDQRIIRAGPVFVIQQILHAGADPFRQFRRCHLGEGDGNDVLHLDASLHQRDHAADQCVSLARAGPRLNDQVGVQVADDAPAGAGVVSEIRPC